MRPPNNNDGAEEVCGGSFGEHAVGRLTFDRVQGPAAWPAYGRRRPPSDRGGMCVAAGIRAESQDLGKGVARRGAQYKSGLTNNRGCFDPAMKSGSSVLCRVRYGMRRLGTHVLGK